MQCFLPSPCRSRSHVCHVRVGALPRGRPLLLFSQDLATVRRTAICGGSLGMPWDALGCLGMPWARHRHQGFLTCHRESCMEFYVIHVVLRGVPSRADASATCGLQLVGNCPWSVFDVLKSFDATLQVSFSFFSLCIFLAGPSFVRIVLPIAWDDACCDGAGPILWICCLSKLKNVV